MKSKGYVNKIFKVLSETIKNPTTELNYSDEFTLLVAVVLSAQSTDKGVNKVTTKLFNLAKKPSDMVKLGEKKIRETIKNIGLYNSKAKNLFLLSNMLINEHKGKVPSERDALVRLPGVGRKTANVVLNTFFGKPYIAVDTHLFRLGNRLGFAKGKTPLEVENRYMETIPKWALKNAHHWLILHGRYTCKAKNPDCDRCKITKYCEFYLKEKIYD
ncbi:MAG: endonuclease III [Alphaproteobacteria bacterium]